MRLLKYRKSNSASDFVKKCWKDKKKRRMIRNNILSKSKTSNSRSYFDVKINKYNILSKSKRSQSAIISTVLLILLVVVATTMIFSFAIPFIKEKLASGNCIDVAGKVTIVDDGRYTCYDEDNEYISFKVRIGEVRELIEGFKIKINSENDASITIKNDTLVTEVTGLKNGTYEQLLELPGDNGAVVYRIEYDEKPDSVEVYPILNEGSVCDSSEYPILIDYC